MIRAALIVAALALPVAAQDEPNAVRTESANGATLRTLDKVSGEVIDVEMGVGQTMAYGPLQITLHECRYPADNRAGDAFGLIQVVDARAVQELFAGWMVASSPALNALEHRRYDVWILNCLSI
ncbi:DUF2155 domain-containing protein [Jannaschia aquimarina]|uniref:DUF2155 domain-containing protein n=1 Tax=Jannaschia aquimarina TaxID=935700 RepID=A0A0D1D2W5_9RHOB|nr:DUF2155 domain-containing protein [Jannaschia aquimarina]KIT14443.1 hypothetical protein jaqu_37310 [Jannaschia aquimarina]SNT29304.1 hypothetical protein SAMN05421775_11068 [Jannaschia aquimarina]